MALTRAKYQLYLFTQGEGSIGEMLKEKQSSDALKIKFDFIVCNLPYLATDEILDIATDGGAEGFEIPKKIFDSVLQNLKENCYFIII